MGVNSIYWLIFIGTALLSWIVSNNLKVKFRKYSQVPTEGGMTGKDIAEQMLRDHDIYDVRVVSVAGALTDHYNPQNKTVNLSHDVYYGNNVAAAAVAAHECGHAVQHATAYSWLTMRSKLVPVVQFSSQWVMWVILGGMLMLNVFPGLLLFGIILFGMTTLFSFVTLPVEIDASQRALLWIDRNAITNRESQAMAESALRAAAYTYVVAALASLATLLYYVYIFLGRRN